MVDNVPNGTHNSSRPSCFLSVLPSTTLGVCAGVIIATAMAVNPRMMRPFRRRRSDFHRLATRLFFLRPVLAVVSMVIAVILTYMPHRRRLSLLLLTSRRQLRLGSGRRG